MPGFKLGFLSRRLCDFAGLSKSFPLIRKLQKKKRPFIKTETKLWFRLTRARSGRKRKIGREKVLPILTDEFVNRILHIFDGYG